MKKIFYAITLFVLTVGLVNYLFNLSEYDFFTQLELISQLDFANPIEEFIELIEDVKSISTWGDLNIQWYEYIVEFFKWLGNILIFPVKLVKTLAIDLYYGLLSVLYLLGFKGI